MIVDDLFPGSSSLPRWGTCQIPDPGVATSVKIPTLGRLSELKFPRVAPPPPPHPVAQH